MNENKKESKFRNINDVFFIENKKKPEHILTFRSDFVDLLLTSNNISNDISDVLLKNVDIEKHFPIESTFFACREFLESVPFFRHPIFYITLEHKGKYAVYKRLNGGDSRLQNQHSIGFGGHVDIEDAISNNSVLDVKKTIELSAQRELYEEIYFPFPIDNLIIETKAYIIDNRDDVGKVHLGVWQNLIIPEDFDVSEVNISKDESHKMEFLGFKDKDWFYNNSNIISFEGWSQMIINNKF